MPLRFDVKKKFAGKSDRVKCVDLHPSEPWILSSLYNGQVFIWNYATQSVQKSFEVTDLPVRTAKFISRKQWLITGSDDMFLRVYNYNTLEKVKTIEAHSDYIRCVVVHPTQPFVLSSSDDMLIKLWDWDKGWTCVNTFEGHTHYVMMITINPKDTNIFASASLDRSIKVWGLGSSNPYFSLENAHEKGVNCLEYFQGGERPYLISGADDKLVKIWDYQNKACVQTLEGHSHNVTVVAFHPELPMIISGSEDGTVRIWHSTTYRLEKTLNYGMERVWAVGYLKGSNYVALGYDEGTCLLKLGRDAPAVSMDNTGKIIWAKHSEIQTGNIKSALESGEIVDGERLPLATKELGNCEIFPQSLRHGPGGRFVVVCGDGEYIIYTALAWRNKSFGSALDFVWGPENGQYGVRESSSKIKVFKNFKETKTFRPSFSAEGIFGGALLAVKGKDFICLYDWEDLNLIRRIDISPKHMYWSDNGELVAIAGESSFFILKYNLTAVQSFLGSGNVPPEDGLEEAFEPLQEISERITSAVWVGDCLIYSNSNHRLNYCVGSEVVTVSHLDRRMYILGYLPRDNRIYLIDKGLNVVSYSLNLTVINYQTAILRGDFVSAEKIDIPQDQRNRVAHFLEAQGLKEEALVMSIDSDHKFELAIQLGKLEVASEIAKEAASEAKWKQLADLALANCKLKLAEEALLQAQDLPGLLLVYSSTGNAKGMENLAQLALEQGKYNIAFAAYFSLRRIGDCLALLSETNRIPEAAFLARTYQPSKVSEMVNLWKKNLQTINPRAADSLADPATYENLFPDIKHAIKAESLFNNPKLRPAADYNEARDDLYRDLIEELKALGEEGFEVPTKEEPATNGEVNSEEVAKALEEPLDWE